MFSNTKRLISLVLPVVAFTTTSCNGVKTVTYEQMRRYASENYDAHALDAIPVNYKADINKCQADILANYSTPEGGAKDLNIAFGLNGIHALIKDRFAYVLSTALVDTIEKYYSDFAGLAISLKEEPPIQMFYQLIGNNCSKISLAANEKLAGSVLIKSLQFVVGVLDLASSFTGFIPTNPDEIKSKAVMTVYQGIYMIATQIASFTSAEEEIQQNALKYTRIILTMMNYATFNISNSSKTNGENFGAYVTTDSYGILNHLNFIFNADFDISGLIAYKQYSSDMPKEGERPSVGSPYHFSLTGSFDFNFNIVSEIL